MERFWARVDLNGPSPAARPDLGPCWVWLAKLDADGYGSFFVGRKRFVKAHRWAYGVTRGPIPDSLELDHLCRVRRCVNPAHLEPVPHRVNVLRGTSFAGQEAGVTHCPRGHPYDEGNTYLRQRRYGVSRTCRACARLHQKRLALRRTGL